MAKAGASSQKPVRRPINKNAKKKSATTAAQEDKGPRRLKPREYKSFRLSKRIKHPVRLPNVYRLSRSSISLLNQHRRLFISVVLVYGVASLLLSQSLGTSDVGSLKDQLNQIFTGNFGQLASSFLVFVSLVSSAGNGSSQVASAYQIILTVIVSLAVIWALRQVVADSKVRMRDAYYQGMTPLIPFLLVLAAISLQLVPLLVGTSLYSLVTANGIATFAAEKFLWALLSGLLALLSFYMVSSSLFALYIVTLPGMTPLKALRSARALVRYRRWTVLRKVIFLPLLMVLLAAIIMIPIILFVSVVAQWAFFVLTMASVALVHSYLYTLYRELLKE
ncbi:MAG: conserved rane protein of unknown function [Candidatus Saccharibacteria bacterium]|nr:conserved rane protein of unknown function [Candidatus Saccharibacteria bacterium]